MHWPFCLAKCPYCDFNSHVRGQVDDAGWRAALIAELRATRAQTGPMPATSLFFGGGTPSLMPPATVAAVIEAVTEAWPPADARDFEITLEANPSSVEAGRFAGYRAAGVNRVSLGVQALEDAALAFLGRLHSAAEALNALEIARRQFEHFSFDLIYARPAQTLAAWRAELARALALAGGHLSLYQLTIEQDTAFFRRHARGDFTLPDSDLAADMFELTQDMTTAAGLPAYEISNHATPGRESRHNLAYWQAGYYAGIGPGAHGRLPDANGAVIATARIARPEDWLAAVERAGHGTAETEPVAPDVRAAEAVMMGLRLTAGIDKALFARRIGRPVESCIDAAALAQMTTDGLLEDTPTYLRPTSHGRLLLNAVTGKLLG